MEEEDDEDRLDPLTIQQLKEEEKLISSMKVCNIRTDHLDISTLKDDLLKVQLEDDFYNVEVLATLFCLFDTVTYIPTDDGQAYKQVTDYLHSLFTGLRRIGAESKNGNALLVGVKSTKGVLIAKSPKSKLNDELFHEYFVGVAALNKLRRLTPNFAYILGAMKCLPPDIAEDKRVVSWCDARGFKNPENLVNYVLYEKVPGESVEDRITNCSASEFFSWFVQICMSLHISRHVQFTHYDLHTGNVMARPWKEVEKMAIPYEVQDGIYWYVKAKTVAQIIDYGMSHILVKGKHFGKRRIEHAGVHPDVYRPMFDLYKFLGFGLLQLLDVENPAALKMIPVWVLMNSILLDKEVPTDPVELKAVLLKQVNTYFALSAKPLEIEETYTVWDFIQAMRKDRVVGRMWSEIVTTEESNLEILSCGDTCPIPAQIEKELTSGPVEDVEQSLSTLRYGKSRNDKSAAMSALPSQIVALRKHMASIHAEILGDMERCNASSFHSVPNTVTRSQFQDLLTEHVEPYLTTKTKLENFETMKYTLAEYYDLKGKKNYSLDEFSFGPTHDQWVVNLRSMQSKVDRLIVPARTQHMQDHVMHMF